MILWYIDRFGLPGRYHTIWLQCLKAQGINPSSVLAISLHKTILGKQLLSRYATRKAPTWHPDAAESIRSRMRDHLAKYRPSAVVLAAPESLACIGLSPEFATLHNLRGGVYRIEGVPHIVTLPMSAWTSLVSQREIGLANYGFESSEAMGSSNLTLRSGPDGVFRSDADRFDHHAASAVQGLSAQESIDDSDDSDTDADNSDGDVAGVTVDAMVDADDDESTVHDDDAGEAGDQFFYEPVLSPVGRFVITADVAKLRRILEHGVNSYGPKEPYILKYR